MGSSAHAPLLIEREGLFPIDAPIGKHDAGVYRLLMPAGCPFNAKLYTFHRGVRWRRSNGSSGSSWTAWGSANCPTPLNMETQAGTRSATLLHLGHLRCPIWCGSVWPISLRSIT